MRNPYEVLGIKADATLKDIRSAFRRRAKQTHPDTDGGDEKAFREVKSAHAILIDPTRREKFDRTGDAEEVHPDNAQNMVLGVVMMALLEAANMFCHGKMQDPATVDMVAFAR